MKYLIADSEENEFEYLDIRGIIDKRLISKPIHILNQDKEEIEIKVPKIIVLININL